MLINLCDNAVKFTDQGSVNLSIACLKEDAESSTLHFKVVDIGIGIEPSHQALLFQPFTQVDSSRTRIRGGTGLGLTIAQRLVTAMGGTIQVTSTPGVGSSFSFELVLPRATASAPEIAEQPIPPARADFQGIQVLFAEDHPLSQEILLEMLEDLGCECDVASNGEEAVAYAQERAYDLVLLDMQMPIMDGLDAARAIRKLPNYSDVPIIALTANAFAQDRQNCIDAGMNDHIGKPVTPPKLAQALGRWLPHFAYSVEDEPVSDNELSRAIAEIPGLEPSWGWRASPKRMALYSSRLKVFLSEQKQDMALLREHLATGNHESARVLVHHLNGVAGLLGAQRIASLASDISQAFRTGGDEAVVVDLVDACDMELARLSEAIQKLPA